MRQLDRLKRLKAEIYRIASEHNARKLYVFGSCARKEEGPESDIDFLADFNSGTSLFDHAGLEYELAEFLGCKVDVIALSALKENAFAANVRKDMVPL